MKICLVGSFSRNLKDEGHTNIGVYLAAQLKERNQVLELDGYKILHPSFWKNVRRFAPDIIHFVPGATIQSFALLRLLKLYTGAKTIMSVVNPRLHSLVWKLVPLLKPDLILNQSDEIERLSNSLSIKTYFLPNGVDTTKFAPVSPRDRIALRQKYGIDKSKFVILHVGHLTMGRGLLPLCWLNGSDSQVLVITSSYFRTNQTVLEILTKHGCLVWQSYFENIWEIYQSADCYVFPTPKNKAICQPLSVLEAMACNLPVVSTKLDGLSRTFRREEVKGLFYMDRTPELGFLIKEAKNCVNVETRQAVLPYSWENIATTLENIFSQMLGRAIPIRKLRKPMFICFTGIDGSGKTTLAKGLVESLNKKGIRCQYVSAKLDPFILKPFIWVGRLIFLRGKSMFNNYSDYSGTKKETIRNHPLLSGIYQQISLFDYSLQTLLKIRLPLFLGKNVVCDRYIHDVVVNLAVELDYPDGKLRIILNKCLQMYPKPDLIFLADVPEEIAYQRKDDVPSLEYLKERRQIYLDIQRECNMINIDGCKTTAELENMVQDFIKEKWKVQP